MKKLKKTKFLKIIFFQSGTSPREEFVTPTNEIEMDKDTDTDNKIETEEKPDNENTFFEETEKLLSEAEKLDITEQVVEFGTMGIAF